MAPQSNRPEDERSLEDLRRERVTIDFASSEPELELDVHQQRYAEEIVRLRRCDESWRPGDPGFRIR